MNFTMKSPNSKVHKFYFNLFIKILILILIKTNFILALSKDERPRKVKILVLEKLPEDNYQLLKYIVQFLSRVSNSQ